MLPRKLFFMECHVAGRKYHDADEVWNELQIGTSLTLVRDRDNGYDPNAVALVYSKTIPDSEETDDYVIGYLPRTENEEISQFLDMGWNSLFECRISMLNEDSHYENQIHVTIKILKNNK